MTQTKTVLVTGATGFLGNGLARRLFQQGHSVRVIARQPDQIITAPDYAPEIIAGDLRDSTVIERAVQGTDKIYHVAAAYRSAGITDQDYYDINLGATQQLLEAAVRHGVERFIHTSTMGVHGHIEDGPADETYRYAPGDAYQRSKLDAELYVHRYAREQRLPYSVVRPCALYGPGDLRLLKLFKLATRSWSPILGDGQIHYHLVYIDDMVQGLVLAGEKTEALGEAFIIGGEEYPTLNELIRLIGQLAHHRARLIHLPAWPVQLLGTACEKICIPLGIEPPIYRRRVDFFTKSRQFDIGKAKRLLGYQPGTSLEQGLSNTLVWYRAQGLLKAS